MLLSEGQMSDYKGAALMIDALPKPASFSATRAMTPTGSARLSPNAASRPASRRNQTAKSPIEHDRELYRQRHKIENMFGRLKDWRRIHTRYDRCAHTFMSAICIAATVIFWL